MVAKQQLLAEYRKRLAERQAASGNPPPPPEPPQPKAASSTRSSRRGKLKDIAQKKAAKEKSFNGEAHPRAAAGSANGGQFVSKQSGAAPTSTPPAEQTKRRGILDVKPPSPPPEVEKGSVQQTEARPNGRGLMDVTFTNGNQSNVLRLGSSRFEGAKAVDPSDTLVPGNWETSQRIEGLMSNRNNLVTVRDIKPLSGSRLTSDFNPHELTDMITQGVLAHAKEGDVVVMAGRNLPLTGEGTPKPIEPFTDRMNRSMREAGVDPHLNSHAAQRVALRAKVNRENDDAEEKFSQDLKEWVAKHPLSEHMSYVGGENRSTSVLVGVVRNGKLTPPTDEDWKRADLAEPARTARDTQMEQAMYVQNMLPAFKSGEPLNDRMRRQIDNEEEEADKAGKLEDEWLGRKPQSGVVKPTAYYKQKADEWAKSQGFDDGGVNGFTAEATKAHDLSHPITHELIGMDSKAIHEHFGSIMQKGGSPSLLGEEAIVNVVEHLSRGDSLESSIISGMRVARVLSRNADYETDEGRSYVRGDDFKDKLFDLADQVYKNDNFSDYMRIVRQSNRISGTVTMAGNDFTQTASGG